MEAARAYFSSRYGVEATGFTVLVGSDYDALSPIYEEMTGADLESSYPPFGRVSDAWVRASSDGGAVVTMMLGKGGEALSSLTHYVVHEYFHVLQGQLASGTAPTGGGEPGYFAGGHTGPRWLMEGLASFADYAYTPSRPGRRPFLNHRYRPYLDISDYQREWGEISLEELAGEEDYRSLGCSFGDRYVYAMGFAASVYLLQEIAEEDSYVRYWALLGAYPTWQRAFEEAFGVGVDDFLEGFREWLPAQLPPARVTLRLRFRWPDMDSRPLRTSFLYASVEVLEEDPLYLPRRSATTGWFGDSDLPTAVAEYPQGTVGTGHLALWWYDRGDLCTEYLLGWYKDGALTSRREEATPVEFTGASATIDWSLPGHPDTLPRLEERTTSWCE